MSSLPKISVIIPVKPGVYPSAMASLPRLDYPAADIEVILAEGKQPSRQRNEAVTKSSGGIICFLDDDSHVAPAHLEQVAHHFVDSAVASVGGPSLTPAGDGLLQQAFGMAFISPFGGGGVRNRYRKAGVIRETDERELILCNLSFRREVFTTNGGFDERLYPNEENELLHRLKEQGYKLLHDPALAVYRSQRQNVKAFAKQLFGYGRGRAEQTLLSRAINLPSLAPSFFLGYLCLLPLLYHPVLMLPLLLYLGLLLFFTLSGIIGSGRIGSGVFLLWIFPLLHVCYGAGMIWGFLAPRYTRRKSVGAVNIKILKPFGQAWDVVEGNRVL